MKILMKPFLNLIAISLLAAVMLFPFARPTQAMAAFSVNTQTDSHDASAGNGACADSGGSCSLRAAVEEANASAGASTIDLPAGTYNLTLGELSIAPAGGKTITIAGEGASTTIIKQSDLTNRVMNIDSSSSGGTNVTISGVTIRDGRDAADRLGGAGILAGSVSSASKDQLTLQNCVISNNQSTSPSTGFTGQPGGGVFMNGGDLTVTNCTFSNNSSANSQGGAIAFVQPDAAAPAAVLKVTGSTFTNNSMSSTTFPVLNGGGAIWINTTAANTGASAHTISASTFTGNTAGSGGVGGAILTQLGTTNITSSGFTGNTASASSGWGGQGGAIYNDSGTLDVSYSRLVSNTAASGSGIYNHSSNNAVTIAANNWWGCNGGPGASGCATTANDSGSGAISATPWIVLSNTASPTTINVTGAPAPNSATLTASFLKNSAGQVLTPVSMSALAGIPVTWENAVLGTLSNQQTITQADGTATATFTAGSQSGEGRADARVDNAVATASLTIVSYTDLSVALSDSPDPVVAGGNLTYTIGFSNIGNNAATTVSVIQSTPANTTFVSAVVSSGSGWTVTKPGVGDTGVVTFIKASVAAAETATMTIVVKVNANAPNSTLSGTVSIDSATYDPNPGNNSATATTTVQTHADLAVTKSAPAQVSAGEGLTYTITLTNNGPSDAQSVTLADALPAGVAFVTQTQSSGASFALSNTGNNVSNTIAILAAGASASFTIQTTVDANLEHATVVSNTASISTTTTDPNTANNTSTASTTANLKADLAVTKTAAASVVAGNNLTYTLTVTNPGPSKATAVALADTMPVGTTFVSQSQASGPTFTLSNTASSINNTISTLPVNGTAIFEVVVRVNPSVLKDTVISNTAAVSAASPDPVSVNNSATASTTVNTQADVSVTKTGPALAVVDSNLTYTITVANTGPSNAAGVTLQDVLPAGVTFVSQSQASGPSFTFSNTGNTLDYASPSLAPNASASFQVIASVNGSVVGGTVISNTATIDSSTSDTNPDNDSATAATTVQASPAFTSADHTDFTIGVAGTFNITTAGYPAAEITRNGSLPSGVTFTDNGDGTAKLSGTPAVGTRGVYPLTFTAHNGIGADAVQTFTLQVNQPPAITSADHVTFNLAEPGQFTITAPVTPTAAITQTGALPSGVTFHDNGDGTAVLSGTPDLGTARTYQITITASNGVPPDATQTFTLTVSKATPLINVAAHPDPVVYDQPVTLTATVTSPLTAPTDTVTFYIDGESVGTATLDASGVATLVTTPPLQTGSRAVRAVYSGDTNFTTVEKSISLQVIYTWYYMPFIFNESQHP